MNKKKFLKILSIVAFFILSLLFFNQKSRVEKIEKPPYKKYLDDKAYIKIPAYWKFSIKDDSAFSSTNYDDSNWDTIPITMNLGFYPEVKNKFKGFCWLRCLVNSDSAFATMPKSIVLSHNGASEIYIDGKLIIKLGKVGDQKQKEEPFSSNIPIIYQPNSKNNQHLIAIRYSNEKFIRDQELFDKGVAGLEYFTIGKDGMGSLTAQFEFNRALSFFTIPIFSIAFILSFIHLFLYLFYRKLIQHLYYSIFALALGGVFASFSLGFYTTIPLLKSILFSFCIGISFVSSFIFLIKFLHSLFKPKGHQLIFNILLILILYSVLIPNLPSPIYLTLFFIIVVIVSIEPIRSIITGIKRKQKGTNIIASGFVLFILFIFTIIIRTIVKGEVFLKTSDIDGYEILFISVGVLSIPISISLYLAFDFGYINKELELQIIEVEALSMKTIKQEKEKQEILFKQNENLEIQVKERTFEVVTQKEIVEQKNKEITDSIEYALRIQTAILPPQRLVKQYLENSFILYKPKDIVAGDFYWMETVDDIVLFAACDCTGHGVPGALVSVVCHNALNRAVREYGLTQPSLILDKTTEIVLENFSRSEEDIKDGMDISLCAFNTKTNTIQWAGANNPLWLIQDGELLETKADKQPIGMDDYSKPFTNHIFNLKTNASIYLFTDGFADQFGGETGQKKLTKKRFKELILSIQNNSIQDQELVLDRFITNYRKEIEQIDDILIIGVRI